MLGHSLSSQIMWLHAKFKYKSWIFPDLTNSYTIPSRLDIPVSISEHKILLLNFVVDLKTVTSFSTLGSDQWGQISVALAYTSCIITT